MKTLYLIAFLFLPFLVCAQARLGSTYADLVQEYSDQYLEIRYANDGTPYTIVNFSFGSAAHYFNENFLVKKSILIPYTIKDLNSIIQVYNDKYVVLSETAWKAYVDGGGIINITLTYNEDTNHYIFHYE
jgi:hypothetical protein